jgi:hypothetical protein
MSRKKQNYPIGSIISCEGVLGVVVFPRKRKKLSIYLNGFDDLDDYTAEWITKNCRIVNSIREENENS